MFRSPNTVELSGVTLELDALHKAYVAIFAQAQEQLENIDLTSDHIGRLCIKLSDNPRFLDKSSDLSVEKLITALRDGSEEDINGNVPLKLFLNVLEKRILTRIDSELTALVNTMVETQIKSAVDTAIADAISNNVQVKRSDTALSLLTQLIEMTNEQTTETTTETNEDTTES